MIDAKRLQSVGPFKQLPKPVLETLSKMVDETRHKPGEMIFEEGTAADTFCVVVEGTVLVTRKAEPKPLELAIIGPGATLGEMALFEDKPRMASISARADTVLWQIKRKDFLALLEQDQASGRAMLLSLIGGLLFRLNATNTATVTLYETGRIIASSTDPHDMVRQCFDALLRVVDAPMGMVAVWDVFSLEYELLARKGIDAESLSEKDPLIAWLKAHPGPLLAEDLQTWKELASWKKAPYWGKSFLAVPLVTAHDFIGALVLVDQKQPGQFGYDEMILASAVSSQMGIAVETIRYRQEDEARARLKRNSIGGGLR